MLPHQGDRVEPPKEPSCDVREVVVVEEGGVSPAQLEAEADYSGMTGKRAEVVLVLVVVGRLEVDGAHVVLLQVLPKALLARRTLLGKHNTGLIIRSEQSCY